MSVLEYKVTSEHARVVDGLGVFAEGETRVFNLDEALWYLRLRGVPLTQDNVPEGVTVVIVSKEG